MIHDSDEITTARQTTLSFYASAPHACSYLPDQTAISVFADPSINMTNAIYSKLAEIGFRRSGNHVYAPNCQQCHACIPVRIPVDRFQPSRNQRRTVARNQNVVVTQRPARYYPQHFQLYKRYLSQRHTNGGMDNPTPESYLDFLTSQWSNTSFFEFTLDDHIVAVSVVDHLPQALSAVYTFFDPDYSDLSLGNYAILWLIDEAHQLGHQWLYLGYWIQESRKMAYKDQYRPLEALLNGCWQRFSVDDTIET